MDTKDIKPRTKDIQRLFKPWLDAGFTPEQAIHYINARMPLRVAKRLREIIKTVAATQGSYPKRRR